MSKLDGSTLYIFRWFFICRGCVQSVWSLSHLYVAVKVHCIWAFWSDSKWHFAWSAKLSLTTWTLTYGKGELKYNTAQAFGVIVSAFGFPLRLLSPPCLVLMTSGLLGWFSILWPIHLLIPLARRLIIVIRGWHVRAFYFLSIGSLRPPPPPPWKNSIAPTDWWWI